MDNLTELYCLMDDFCKEFEATLRAKLIADGKVRRHRLGDCRWPNCVLFHLIRYRQFKFFYLY